MSAACGGAQKKREHLKSAQKSIRVQALIFAGDESGLRVSEVLKDVGALR